MDGGESRRLELLPQLEAVLGKQEAETLMAHLPPTDWSRLVTTDYLDTRLDILRSELRSEMSQTRLDMARWGRTQIYATLGAVVATGGLAFAAAGLA